MTPSIRPYGADMTGSSVEHSFGFVSYATTWIGFLVYRHHRRLVYHDSPATDIDKSITVPKSMPMLAGKHFFEFAEHNFIRY